MTTKPSKPMYSRPQLKRKLNAIYDYPCTAIVAPIGFGKSSVLHEFIQGVQDGTVTKVRKVSAYGLDPFWIEFKTAFGFDSEVFLDIYRDINSRLRLKRIFDCISSTIGDGCLIAAIDFDMYDPDSEIRFFLDSVVRLLPDNIHLILISRVPMFHSDSTLSFYGIVNYILKADLLYDTDEIKQYYKENGIQLSDAEASGLLELSGGWVSILYNGIKVFQSTGRHITIDECNDLLYKVMISPLNDKIKRILHFVSLCGFFSMQQMLYLCEDDEVESLLTDLVNQGLFIEQNTITGMFMAQKVFLAALQMSFENQPKETKDSIINRMGMWYLTQQENHLARQCFYKTRNYESLMIAVEKRRFMHPYVGDEQFFLSYYSDTPEEIRKKHPMAILIFAKHLFSRSEKELAETVCDEFLGSLSLLTDSSEKNYYMGMYELLLCYGNYNDLGSMLMHLERAEKRFMGVTGKIIWPETGFNDFPSILALYHRVPGRMDDECIQYKDYNRRYSRFSDDRIMGADLVMQAEVLFMRGNLAGAEIIAKRAMLLSNKAAQWGVWLSVKYIQIRIQLMNGKWDEVKFLLDEVRDVCNEHNDYMLVSAIELCEAYVYSKLGMAEFIQKTFSDDSWEENMGVNSRALPLLYTIYGEVLLSSEKYTQFIAHSPEYIMSASKHPNILALIILNIETAGAYEKIKQPKDAIKYLKAAIELSEPDDIILPYVEFYPFIKDSLGLLPEKKHELVNRIRKEALVFESHLNLVRNRYFSKNDFNLTPMENKICSLVIQGMSNRDIAADLFISEATVKTHMLHIFSKMGIHKRSQMRKLV